MNLSGKILSRVSYEVKTPHHSTQAVDIVRVANEISRIVIIEETDLHFVL